MDKRFNHDKIVYPTNNQVHLTSRNHFQSNQQFSNNSFRFQNFQIQQVKQQNTSTKIQYTQPQIRFSVSSSRNSVPQPVQNTIRLASSLITQYHERPVLKKQIYEQTACDINLQTIKRIQKQSQKKKDEQQDESIIKLRDKLNLKCSSLTNQNKKVENYKNSDLLTPKSKPQTSRTDFNESKKDFSYTKQQIQSIEDQILILRREKVNYEYQIYELQSDLQKVIKQKNNQEQAQKLQEQLNKLIDKNLILNEENSRMGQWIENLQKQIERLNRVNKNLQIQKEVNILKNALSDNQCNLRDKSLIIRLNIQQKVVNYNYQPLIFRQLELQQSITSYPQISLKSLQSQYSIVDSQSHLHGILQEQKHNLFQTRNKLEQKQSELINLHYVIEKLKKQKIQLNNAQQTLLEEIEYLLKNHKITNLQFQYIKQQYELIKQQITFLKEQRLKWTENKVSQNERIYCQQPTSPSSQTKPQTSLQFLTFSQTSVQTEVQSEEIEEFCNKNQEVQTYNHPIPFDIDLQSKSTQCYPFEQLQTSTLTNTSSFKKPYRKLTCQCSSLSFNLNKSEIETNESYKNLKKWLEVALQLIENLKKRQNSIKQQHMLQTYQNYRQKQLMKKEINLLQEMIQCYKTKHLNHSFKCLQRL